MHEVTQVNEAEVEYTLLQLIKSPLVMWETWVQSLGGKIPWRRERHPLQYSDLENPMDGVVHGVTKSRTRLSDVHFLS